MSLAAGSHLGSYQIVAPLGAGGPPSLGVLKPSYGEVSPKPSTRTR